MEGEQGDLDQEGQGESQEAPELDVLGKRVFEKLEVVETFYLVGHVDQGHQHEKRAQHRVEDEFNGGLDPIGPAPDSDQEKSGNQHQFPKEVKKKKVGCHQGADHGGFQQQQRGVITPDVFLDTAEASQHHPGSEEGGQQDQPKGKPVQTQAV